MPHILVVEDDELLLRMYESIFVENHFHVTLATDGQAAVTTLEHLRPDLILVDIVMPKIDGLDLLRHVKADAALAHIPVVVMTSLTDPATAASAMKLGAARYLLKSEHRPQDVVEVARECLKLVK